MSSLGLKIYPDPCLRIRTKPVEQFSQDLEEILRSMADSMYLSQGIGLAATQVGLGLSIVVIDIGEGLMNFINPVILEKSEEKSRMEERCLSLPGVTVNVVRSVKIKVRAQNEEGQIFVKNFNGLSSRALQHEIDHLHGRLIIDYLDPFRYFIVTRRLARSRHRETAKTCEVVCDVGKRHRRGT